jgi:hypothetical protein
MNNQFRHLLLIDTKELFDVMILILRYLEGVPNGFYFAFGGSLRMCCLADD